MRHQSTGRISSKRISGDSLYFYDVKSEGEKIQLFCSRKYSNWINFVCFHSNRDYGKDFDLIHHSLKRGDIIGIEGIPGRTKTGELSIYPKEIKLLAPCLRMLSKEGQKLTESQTRFRNRHLDLLTNEHVIETFKRRSQIIKFLRTYLESRNFLEVETPILQIIPGGASARPFNTHLKVISSNHNLHY